jgi:hypothetical protein
LKRIGLGILFILISSFLFLLIEEKNEHFKYNEVSHITIDYSDGQTVTITDTSIIEGLLFLIKESKVITNNEEKIRPLTNRLLLETNHGQVKEIYFPSEDVALENGEIYNQKIFKVDPAFFKIVYGIRSYDNT